jgi:hypothetical protein
MFKNLISSIYIYLIVAATSAILSGYFAYSWTSDYYVAKIEHANILAEKKINDIQRKGDEIVANYIKQIDKLGSVNASLQKQISSAVRTDSNATCAISSGFVRVYDASAVGEASTPSSTDGATSAVDIATILSVAAENNAKYLKVAQQLIDLQAFENAR